MIQHLLKAGFIAGLAVGLAIAVLQHFTTSQLILQGEVYEKAAEHHQHAGLNRSGLPILLVHDHSADAAATEPDEDDEGWQPARRLAADHRDKRRDRCDLDRLCADPARGDAGGGRADHAAHRLTVGACRLSRRQALRRRLACRRHCPAVPQRRSSRVSYGGSRPRCARRGGLFLLARLEQTSAKAFGLVLILLPHLVGAPKIAKFTSTAPAELAAQFAATSLVLSAVLWALLGLATGYAWQRVAQPRPVAALA